MDFQIHDVMMPDEWYSHEHQAQLFRTNIKYPVFSDAIEGYNMKNSKCYVANFGDESLRHLFDKSEKGDPLFYEKREQLCLLFTPIIKGFDYELSMFGKVVNNTEVQPGYIPEYFVKNALHAQQIAQTVMKSNMSREKYDILGAKLNQLSSGRCNIVMYLRFPNGCPFAHQTYLRSHMFPNAVARVMPRPIVHKFKVDVTAVKLTFKFLDVVDIFHEVYAFIRGIVTNIPGLFLRFVKQRNDTKCLEVVCQLEDDANIDIVHASLLTTDKRWKLKTAFSPYVFTGFEWEFITI